MRSHRSRSTTSLCHCSWQRSRSGSRRPSNPLPDLWYRWPIPAMAAAPKRPMWGIATNENGETEWGKIMGSNDYWSDVALKMRWWGEKHPLIWPYQPYLNREQIDKWWTDVDGMGYQPGFMEPQNTVKACWYHHKMWWEASSRSRSDVLWTALHMFGLSEVGGVF